jgi:hypothetical protein
MVRARSRWLGTTSMRPPESRACSTNSETKPALFICESLSGVSDPRLDAGNPRNNELARMTLCKARDLLKLTRLSAQVVVEEGDPERHSARRTSFLTLDSLMKLKALRPGRRLREIVSFSEVDRTDPGSTRITAPRTVTRL